MSYMTRAVRLTIRDAVMNERMYHPYAVLKAWVRSLLDTADYLQDEEDRLLGVVSTLEAERDALKALCREAAYWVLDGCDGCICTKAVPEMESGITGACDACTKAWRTLREAGGET